MRGRIVAHIFAESLACGGSAWSFYTCEILCTRVFVPKVENGRDMIPVVPPSIASGRYCSKTALYFQTLGKQPFCPKGRVFSTKQHGAARFAAIFNQNDLICVVNVIS